MNGGCFVKAKLVTNRDQHTGDVNAGDTMQSNAELSFYLSHCQYLFQVSSSIYKSRESIMHYFSHNSLDILNMQD